MAMEDEDVGNPADRTTTHTGTKQGGDPGVKGTCIDRQPDTVIHPAGLKQPAGRGSRSGPAAHAATGIRVLKASHAEWGGYSNALACSDVTKCPTMVPRAGSMSRYFLRCSGAKCTERVPVCQ